MRYAFAHLCTWFSTPEISGKYEMWNSDYVQKPHDPNKILYGGKRDIAAPSYPLSGLYDSGDERAIRMQLSLMKACGIDGVIVDWDGRRLNPARHEKFLKLLPLLSEFDLKLVVCFEEWSGYYPAGTFSSREEELNAVKEEFDWLYEHCISKPFYFKENGRPLLFIFRKIPSQWFNLSEWKRIKEHTDRFSVDIFFNDCYDESLCPVADGYYFWVGGFDKNNANTLEFCEKELKTYKTQLRKIGAKAYVPSVASGFDDSYVWGWGDGARVAPRYDGKRYEMMWEEAIASGERLVQIVTWNDWNEGSQIEPCDRYGYLYLNLTKEYICKLKGRLYESGVDTCRKIIEKYIGGNGK